MQPSTTLNCLYETDSQPKVQSLLLGETSPRRPRYLPRPSRPISLEPSNETKLRRIFSFNALDPTSDG